MYLWGLLLAGGMTEKEIISLCYLLPTYLRLDNSNNLSRALSCLRDRLSGHIFLVQRMRHNRNRRPYELRICDKCDWHSVQDEEHIFLDCPHEHFVSLTAPPAGLPTSIWKPNSFEDFFEPTRYIWCGIFHGWVPNSLFSLLSFLLFL